MSLTTQDNMSLISLRFQYNNEMLCICRVDITDVETKTKKEEIILHI